MRATLVAVLCSLAVASIARAADPALTERSWTVDGLERKALVHTPIAATTAPTTSGVPLVFAFHGHGGSMKYAAERFALHKLWPEALVVYMQGLPVSGITDPEGKLPGWQKAPGDQGDRDLHFFDAVLASLEKDVKVDARRIFAMGHSNGGAFTYLLWATRGSVFAAVAPAAAAPGRYFRDLTPLPALQVSGEKDEIVSFQIQKRAMDSFAGSTGATPWARSGRGPALSSGRSIRRPRGRRSSRSSTRGRTSSRRRRRG